MDISTASWFNYLHEEVLTEGLRDIGLPEFVIDYLEDAMPDTSEKARMYIANNWKKSRGGMADATMVDNLQWEVAQFLIDDVFRNYVITNNSYEHGTNLYTRDPVARVVAPYDLNQGSNQPRDFYDEERMEQNKRVAFVIANIRNALGKPQGTWRKAFMKAVKALSKAGLPSEKVESFKEYLRSLAGKNFHYWLNQYSELVSFLNDDPTNYELIKDEYSIQDAQNKALEYLANKEDPEFIIHTFDDGSYWYNLNVSSCDVEASRMGHCGSDSRGTLVSLRKKQGKRRESSSYVTMTYSDYENTIYQIKGRQNDAPPEDVWDHIAWFIDNMRVENVEETGEHSGDQEGIQEMIEYLSQETNANFHGSIEDRLEKAEEYCQGQVERYNDNQDELQHGSVGYSLEEEMNDIYCYASAEYSFEIDLGWPDYSATDTGYTPDGAEFEDIPRSYSGLRELIDELGIDDMIYEMPGDDGDWDVSLRKLVGAQPEDEEFDPNPDPTVHLVITLFSNETFSVDEDGEVIEFAVFVNTMLEFEEDEAPAYKESIRQNLAAGGYTAKSAYDRSREELMKLTNLDKWHVKQDKGGLEFDWTADDGQPLHTYTGKFDSARAQMYGTGTGNRMGVNPDAVFREIFGYGPAFSFANMRGTNDYSIQFARELSKNITTHLKSKASAPGQQKLDFGDKHAGADPTMVLADDTDFVVFQDVNYRPDGNRERYPLIKIKWLYRMRVNPQSPPEEFEIIQEIAAFLNENEELVTAAADKIIGMALEGHSEKINKRRDKIMDNYQLQIQINNAKKIYGDVLDQYGDEEGYGSTAEIARKVYAIITWFEDNYADMGEAERYIMATKFIIPMLQNNFRSYSEMGEIDRNTGAPVMFGELVPHQVAKMGGQPVNMVTRNQAPSATGTMGAPRPAQENKKTWNSDSERDRLIEEALSIINERDPSYDLRIYQILIKCSMSKQRGGQRGETETEIRGIDGVTVVSGVTFREDAQNWYSTLKIKFELLGRQSRDDYMKLVLLPSLLKIKGFKIVPGGMGKAELVSKELSEVAGFGGMTAGAANAPRQGPFVPTPTPSIQDLIDAWVSSGERVYDIPTDNNEMSYHTMVNVEELWGLITSPFYRNTTREFDSVKKNIINHGTYNPIVVAIGKNGRAKITGGIDIVFAAKDLGLRELPTIFMYQHQV